MNKSWGRFYLFASLHAAWVTLFAFFLVQIDYMKGDEAWLTKTTSAVLRLLISDADKPAKEDYAFINVCYDKILIDRLDTDGFPAGNYAITDRYKLAKLFSAIKKESKHKFILCDIIFPDPSPADSALSASVSGIPNLLFSTARSDSGGTMMPPFPVPATALAEYRQVDNDFLKFMLVRDTIETVPLKMFRMLDGGTYKKGKIFSWLNGKLALNAFVLDFRIRQFDLLRLDTAYAYANLHVLTDLIDAGQEKQVLDFVRDRIVVIGDFEDRDMHSTMYGKMAGPLILLNLYLALKAGDNLISPWFFVFLFGGFLFASVLLFSGNDFLETWLERRTGPNSMTWKFIIQGAAYTFLFGLISILSFLLFKIHINFILLSLYFNIWEWAKVWIENRRTRNQNKSKTLTKLP